MKIEVVRSAQGLDAHIWNACKTGACDYGVHHLAVSGNTSTYDFTSGNRRFLGTMTVYALDILLLSLDSYEPGTLNHWHHTRVLSNPDLSGKIQVAFSRYVDSLRSKGLCHDARGSIFFSAQGEHGGGSSQDRAPALRGTRLARLPHHPSKPRRPAVAGAALVQCSTKSAVNPSSKSSAYLHGFFEG